jgi:hypothetical protein
MTPMRILISLILALGLGLGPAAADQWLHVRVEDSSPDGEQVNINVPLSVVEAVLPHISVEELDRGKLRLDDDDLELDEGIDLPAILQALRDSPDTDFVTVRSNDESVRVAKENDYLLVHVEERDGESTVNVRVPMAVVEALASSGPHELDLVAALRVLRDYEGEPLVTVESEDETVRIWIDSSETGL